MQALEKIKKVYFIGIGGIGMSALARYFKISGREVAGYDRTPSSLTAELIEEGMDVHYEDDITLVPESFRDEATDETLVVFTPAVPEDHRELGWFRAKGYSVCKRSEVLGIVTRETKTIAVAGTHGKTTTSTMVTHILKTNGTDCWAFLGGISQNYHTNVLQGKTDIAVVEADEYDRSFLSLFPHTAIITSLDPDHLDIYGSADEMIATYSRFASQVMKDGTLIIKSGLRKKIGPVAANVLEYDLEGSAAYHAENIRVESGSFVYDIVAGEKRMSGLRLGVPGRHNIENSVAAVAAALQVGVNEQSIRLALESYRGVRRRFEYYIRRDDLVLIDDYAHHPAELKATISAVRELYPGKKITGVFQPHLYTRTRDFADEFARSLGMLDELLLLEIYPARELPIRGINSSMLLEKVDLKKKRLVSKDELAHVIASEKQEIVLMMGAGDIELLVEPVKKALV